MAPLKVFAFFLGVVLVESLDLEAFRAFAQGRNESVETVSICAQEYFYLMRELRV